jgi:succinate-semialdehyde dehydrogenase/glutarate-semialdehyde dehydrogenase
MTYPDLALVIAGRRVAAEGRETRAVLDPATGAELGRLPMATMGDVDAAVEAAAAAFAGWRDLGGYGRARVLGRVPAILRARVEALARLITLELGKPLAESRAEVETAAGLWEWNAQEARRGYGRVIPPRAPGMRQLVLREPVGPVAAFSSWNAPLITPSRKIGGALAAGCPVVMKPAEEVPATALALADALREAELPQGLLSVLFGDPAAISERLMGAEAIRCLSFTGSTRVGTMLGQRALASMKRVILELGGHAPVLVFDDVDAASVARAAAAAKFRNAGQVCTSPTRFLVARAAYPRFRDAFAEAARGIRVGSGLDEGTEMGPLAHPGRVEAMEALVADARARGAAILAGGGRVEDRGDGFFFEPTVIAEAGPELRAMTEEPFGPLALIGAFDDEAGALAEANRLPAGLTAYLATNDAARITRVSDALRAGNVIVNHWAASLPETPFGGHGSSGMAQEGGIEGIEAFQLVKFVSQR